MSFVTKEWKDRLAEFAGRRKLTNVSTGEETTVDVSRAEGEVSQAGDAFSAANMNDLEQRIKDGFDKVDTNLLKCEIVDKGGDVSASSVFPFTAEHDGVMSLVMNPSSTSTAYLHIEDDSKYAVGTCFAIDGLLSSMCFAIQKGKTYKVQAASNVSSIRRPQILYLYK